jgi:hypothetical protein
VGNCVQTINSNHQVPIINFNPHIHQLLKDNATNFFLIIFPIRSSLLFILHYIAAKQFTTMSLGFALNLAGVVVPIGIMLKPVEVPTLASTKIQIIVGHKEGDNDNKDPSDLGGGCPDVALWDDC